MLFFKYLLRISLKNMANDSDDPNFLKALEIASKNQKSSQDPYVDLFFEAFNNIEGAKLSFTKYLCKQRFI